MQEDTHCENRCDKTQFDAERRFLSSFVNRCERKRSINFKDAPTQGRESHYKESSPS
jgi:hypothetical protein